MLLSKPRVLSLVLCLGAIVDAQGPTTMSGVVERADGTPEKGAVVEFSPDGPSSGLRGKAVTNEKGEFSLEDSYIGLGLLSASKAEEGYPDAVLAFYNLRDYKSAQDVNLKGLPISGLLLKFSDPSPRIELTVRPQGQAVSSVQFTVRSTSKTDVYATFTWDPAQMWSFVIPKNPVTIVIVAPNHQQWTYTTIPSASVKNGVVPLIAELRESLHSAAPQRRP